MSVGPFDYTLYGDSCGFEWEDWVRSFELCAEASNIQDNRHKKVLLLHFAGTKVQQLFDSLPEPEIPNGKGPRLNITRYVPHMTEYELALEKLNRFFQREKNFTYERHVLRQMKQALDEKIDRFVVRLQKQAKRCKFDDQEKENVKDQVIAGCRSSALRREMLKKGCAGLDEILSVAQIFETVTEQEKSFTNELKPPTAPEEVNKIDVKPTSWKQQQSVDLRSIECNRCGFKGHKANADNCPAKGKTCNKCGGRDHFFRVCRSMKRSRNFDTKSMRPQDKTKIEKAESDDEPAGKQKQTETVKLITAKDSEYIFCISDREDSNSVKCKIGNIETKAIVDSGSKFNLMDENSWAEMKGKNILVSNQRKETSKIFTAYGGHTLTIIGVFEAKIEIGCHHVMADFYVIKGDGKLLLGRDTAMMLGILKIDCDVHNIEEKPVEELSKIKDVVVEIPIKKDAKPIMQSYRRVPVALEEAVDKKIEELLKQGIIEPVDGPSKWVSPVVIIPKENDIRICVDMRRANEAVERENHPLPTMEDFLPHIGKGKWFTKLDIKNAFHQVDKYF